MAVIGLPALVGHPIVNGDNQIQNLPLRALSGALLSQGHLPLWDQYIWSGTPLLAGLNAGALYPSTLLFAVVPVTAAWTLNLVIAYWVAGAGLYLLLGLHGLDRRARLLAAASFAFAGTMMGQIVHIELIQATGWLPWIALALEQLSIICLPSRAASSESNPDPNQVVATTSSEMPGHADGAANDPLLAHNRGASTRPRSTLGGQLAPTDKSPLAWAGLLAFSVGMVFLTGSTRGMADAMVVGGFITLWELIRPIGSAKKWPLTLKASLKRSRHNARLKLAAYAIGGAIWGVALGAVQILPGVAFSPTTQRVQSAVSKFHFGAGSLDPKMLLLMLVPDLLGGAGFLHQPSFFGTYNLAELTSYVGILPLVAFFALLARSFGNSRSANASRWLKWHGLAVLGLLLALGTFTPLGSLLRDIPFYDELRLQSRNIAIVDFALTVLLGFWADRILAAKLKIRTGQRGPADCDEIDTPTSSPDAIPVEPRLRPYPFLERVAGSFPPLAVAATALAALLLPRHIEAWMGAPASATYLGRYLAPSFVADLIVALAATALVWTWPKMDRKRRRVALSSLVMVDLLVFIATCAGGLSVSQGPGPYPQHQAVAVLGTNGRFAIYDPAVYHLSELAALGQPDLNTLTKRSSVQGYGALLSARYDRATGTHLNLDMNPCALESGAMEALDLKVLLTLPAYLIEPVTSNAIPTPQPASPTCGGGPKQVRAPTLGSVGSHDWYFGQNFKVNSVSIAFTGRTSTPGSVKVAVLTPYGQRLVPAQRLVATGGNRETVQFLHPTDAIGLITSGPGSALVGQATTFTTASGARYALDGPLELALHAAGWSFAGTWDAFTVFKTSSTYGNVWLQSSMHSAPSKSLGAAREIRSAPWGTTTYQVSSNERALLVRSEAYGSGWSATIATPGATRSSKPIPAIRVGLVQGVWVPPGRYTVTFAYHAPGLDPGLAATLASLLALVALGLGAMARALWRIHLYSR